MDNFISIAEDKIQQLRSEDEHVASTIRGLEARRAELQREIEAGVSALAYYRQVMDVPEKAEAWDVTGDVRVVEARHAPQRRTGPTVGDRLEEYMAGRGGEAQVSQLADHLVATGVYPEDERQSLYRRVYAMLLRDKRFFKVSPGKFGLIPQGTSLTLALNAAAWIKEAAEQTTTVVVP